MSTSWPSAAFAAGSTATGSFAFPTPVMRMIWQNTSTGDRSIWLMDGASWNGSYAALPQVPTVWSIAGSEDFNADGFGDILWQNTTTGERSIWFMSGTTWNGSYVLLPQVPTQWSIAGVGDFNADGKPDIVWQNTSTGDRSIWLMNDANISSYALLPQVSTQWSIATVGDFNADGKPDLVWQNTTTGERSIWFMNGPSWSGSYTLLPTVPTAWRIAAAGDFDGDNQADLVWQNLTTGERSIWFMNGSSWGGSYALLPTVPIAWNISALMAPATTPAVSISSISPDIMIPGAAITVFGTGFAPSIGGNNVTIDGVAASVTAASPTQLTVTVPTTLPCTLTHGASVNLVTSSGTASAVHPLRVGVLRSLATGGSVVIGAGNEVGCNELSAVDGRYIVSIFNTTESPAVSSATGFRLSGAVTPGIAAAAAGPSVLMQTAAGRRTPRTLTRDETQAAERSANHTRVLEINLSLFGLVKSNFRKRAAINASGAMSMQAPVPAVGDLRNFRINNFSGTCTGYNEITARVVYVGQKAVLFEDVAAPLAGTMNAYYGALGQQFDATMYLSDLTNFADPLATDPYTDSDGHINMIFSRTVNDLGVGGFVIACDFYPRNATDNTSSNLGENFYAVVPTVAGSGFSSDTPDSWYRSIRTTAVHEVKHIASFGSRLLNPNATGFQDSWLEEGTARHAEELWLRNYVYGTPWKSNITYAASVYCDLRPTFPECAGAPFGIASHFFTLYDFLDNPAAYSPFGPVASGDFNFYASAWSLVRWAIDRYASTEPVFLTGLTQSELNGMGNVVAQSGAAKIDILGDWSLALYLDENATFASNPSMKIPTWNTRDIFFSLNRDIPGSFPKPFPLTPTAVNAGDFSADNNGIRGGSFAIYDVSGAAPAGRALSLKAFGGSGAASPSLRIAIARIQ
jgi:uncharacterized protein (TIGR03437 family)